MAKATFVEVVRGVKKYYTGDPCYGGQLIGTSADGYVPSSSPRAAFSGGGTPIQDALGKTKAARGRKILGGKRSPSGVKGDARDNWGNGDASA